MYFKFFDLITTEGEAKQTTMVMIGYESSLMPIIAGFSINMIAIALAVAYSRTNRTRENNAMSMRLS
jgi:hypothetical protein